MGGSVTRDFYKDIYEGLDALGVYRQQVDDAFTYFNQAYQDYRDQYLFWMLNQQWDSKTVSSRKTDSKPTLTLNLGYSIINEILGEDRDATPGLVIRSDDPAYEESAEIIDGIIRQIMYESRFSVLRQIVLRNCMVGGFGVFEIKKEYESFDSLDQTLRIYADDDSTSYYFDPGAKEVDKSDGDFCGRIYDLSLPYYRKLFPEAKSDQSFQVPVELSRVTTQYQTGAKRIFIARHIVKEYFNRKLARLSDGSCVDEKNWRQEIDRRMELQQEEYLMGYRRIIEPIKVVATDEKLDYKIIERYLNGNEEIKKSEWQSRYFPLIYVDGDSSRYQGQQYTKGFMKFAQSQQELLNYVSSELAVYLVTSKRPTVMGTDANFDGYEQEWDDNSVSRTRVRANVDPITKSMPIPFNIPPFPESLIPLMQSLSMNIRNVAARNTSNDGSGSQVRSGRAEETRITQGNQPSNVYIDNVNRGMESVGRCLASLVPVTFDTTREVTLRAKNNKTSKIIINNPTEGNAYLNEIKDNVNIVVEVGGSFAQQREAQNKMLLSLAAVNPKANEVLPDIIANNLDLSNSEEVVERMQLILPPEVRQKILKEPAPPPQPNPMLLMQQQELNNEMMQTQTKQEQIELDRQKLALESRNALLQHEATLAKINAEKFRAESQVKQTAMTHHIKMTDSSHENEIQKLVTENDNLKKALSQILGVNPTEGMAPDDSEYAA